MSWPRVRPAALTTLGLHWPQTADQEDLLPLCCRSAPGLSETAFGVPSAAAASMARLNDFISASNTQPPSIFQGPYHIPAGSQPCPGQD